MFQDGLVPAIDGEALIDKVNMVSYRTITGALIHLSCHTRPDISFEVASLSKYNHAPTAKHWEAAKQLLRYLKYSADECFALGGTDNLIPKVFADSGHGMDKTTGRSAGGYTIFLGKSLIAHKSSWFKSVYTSSTESELAAMYLAVQNIIWLKKLLASLYIKYENPIQLLDDNQGAIKYCYSQERAGRLKHIDIKFFWIREQIEQKYVSLEYVNTNDNVVDIMTKSIRGEKLERFKNSYV